MTILIAAHTRKPGTLSSANQHCISAWGTTQRGKGLIDEVDSLLSPDSGALRYFHAWCSLLGDDRATAIDDLTKANALLKTNDPFCPCRARLQKLLERVQLNAQGQNWSKFTDPDSRYSFEHLRPIGESFAQKQFKSIYGGSRRPTPH